MSQAINHEIFSRHETPESEHGAAEVYRISPYVMFAQILQSLSGCRITARSLDLLPEVVAKSGTLPT